MLLLTTGEQGDAYDRHTSVRPSGESGPAEPVHQHRHRPILAAALKGRDPEQRTRSICPLPGKVSLSQGYMLGYLRIYYQHVGISQDILSICWDMWGYTNNKMYRDWSYPCSNTHSITIQHCRERRVSYASLTGNIEISIGEDGSITSKWVFLISMALQLRHNPLIVL